MTIWTFNQPGSIPGIPGTFAGVRVEVDDATMTVRGETPLTLHAEFESAPEDAGNVTAVASPDDTASEP